MLLKIGHRGAKTYEIENTLAGFKKAIELGANAVELDLRISADGKLIISHDDNLKKVYGKDILIKDATLSELKELTEGRIATLDEVLPAIKGTVEKVLVELKEAGFEKKVLDLVEKEGMRDNVIILSFHEDVLEQVRGLDREIETGLVYARYKGPIDAALRLNAQYLVPLYRFVHRRDVAKAHKSGLKVIVWTINSKDEAILYKAKDVDGIATDKPAILKGIV